MVPARRESAVPDPFSSDGLDAAARRLDQALLRLERRVSLLGGSAPRGDESARLRLEAELQTARERERELEEVASAASAALGRAAAEVRAALAAEA
jgi:hypothetical protein